jgi:two-component system LytT family response regulator
MSSIRTLIVDDEPLARRNLRTLLKSHMDCEVVGECSNGRDTIDLLSSQSIDLLFLDIQMPEMNGFQVLEKLESQKMPLIIFVTAFNEFAIKAFEVSATDYLLKPVDDKRFGQALEKARALLSRKNERELERRMLTLLESHDSRNESGKHCQRLLIKTNSRVFFLAVEDIDYIEADDYYSAIHVGAKTHLLREPMKDLEARLDPKEFVRIHRSAIVNVRRIKELRTLPSGGHAVHLLDGTALRLSRSRWESLKAVLK